MPAEAGLVLDGPVRVGVARSDIGCRHLAIRAHAHLPRSRSPPAGVAGGTRPRGRSERPCPGGARRVTSASRAAGAMFSRPSAPRPLLRRPRAAPRDQPPRCRRRRRGISPGTRSPGRSPRSCPEVVHPLVGLVQAGRVGASGYQRGRSGSATFLELTGHEASRPRDDGRVSGLLRVPPHRGTADDVKRPSSARRTTTESASVVQPAPVTVPDQRGDEQQQEQRRSAGGAARGPAVTAYHPQPGSDLDGRPAGQPGQHQHLDRRRSRPSRPGPEGAVRDHHAPRSRSGRRRSGRQPARTGRARRPRARCPAYSGASPGPARFPRGPVPGLRR